MVLMIKESNVAENILLISGLITLYAFQQGDEKEIQGKPVNDPKRDCSEWHFKSKENVLSTCGSGANCTFFFLQDNVITANEWFGMFEIDSRGLGSADESFSRFQLLVLYDNIDEQKIGELPKIIFNSSNFTMSNEVINFSIDKRYKNLTLGVWGPNFCGTLKRIRFYYYQCPSSTIALVNFKATLAPSKNSSSILLKGDCVDNAVQSINSSSLSMKCYYNGSYEVFGSCLCKAGYSNLDNGKTQKICKRKFVIDIQLLYSSFA